MEFINTGLDNRILKSMDAEHPSDELVKAMNRQGLVQKEVQVKGKNGQTFTRKQWVRASGASGDSSTTVRSDKKEDEKNVTLKGAKLLMYNDKRIPYSLSNAAFGFTENMRRTKFPHIKNTGYKDSAQAFREIIESAKPTGKGVCDALNSSGIGYRNWRVTSESDDKIVIQASDTLGNKTNLAVYPVISQKSDNSVKFDKTQSGKVGGIQVGKELAPVVKTVPSGAKKLREVTDKDTGKTYSIYTDTNSNKPDGIVAVENDTNKSSKPSLSDIQGYGYDSSTATGDPTLLKIGDKSYYKIRENKWQYSPNQGSALGGTYTDAQMNEKVSKATEEVKVYPSSKKNSVSQSVSQSKDKDLSQMSESELKDRMKQVTKRISELSNEMNNNGKSKGQLNSVATDSQKKEYDRLVDENGNLMVELGKRKSAQSNKVNQNAVQFKDWDDAYKAGEADAGKTSKSDKKVVESVKKQYIDDVYRKGKGMSDSQQDKLCKKIAKQCGVSELSVVYEMSKQFEEYYSQSSKKNSSTQTTQPSVPAQKLSPAEAKSKTKEVTKNVTDKKSFMEKAKAQGITWKENDHEGINWMRCCMAMNKHFENGGSFDEK